MIYRFLLGWNRTTRLICLVWLYDMIDICTRQSISVLDNRYLYYTIDICTTHSIFVLHWIILFWEKKHNTQFHIKTVVFNLQIFTWLESYYKVNLFSVVIRHDLYLYSKIDICTTQSISVLHHRYLYYTIDICTTHSLSVLHNRYLYYTF